VTLASHRGGMARRAFVEIGEVEAVAQLRGECGKTRLAQDRRRAAAPVQIEDAPTPDPVGNEPDLACEPPRIGVIAQPLEAARRERGCGEGLPAARGEIDPRQSDHKQRKRADDAREHDHFGFRHGPTIIGAWVPVFGIMLWLARQHRAGSCPAL